MSDHPSAGYRAIADEIALDIDAGRIGVGEKVPSARAIARDFGVAIATATRVLADLQRRGLVEPVHGVGTVVRDGTSPADAPAPASPEPLGRDQIVRAGLDIADAEGLDAVSMRRVAAHLGVSVMSLYHHVDGKDHLIRQMADEAFREALPERSPEGWRPRLEAMCRLEWEMYRRHPWLARTVSLTRPALVPNAIAHTEWGLSAFDGMGVPDDVAVKEMLLLSAFVLGLGMAHADEENSGEQSLREWWEERGADFEEVLQPDSHPRLSRVEHPGSLDDMFEYGLKRHMDGLGAVIDRYRA
ncbi:TetR/AcrR family transcriptional regulator C-terminal domain-containing protein [Salininema proteolyticum]|uniref:TetR/AcrR family transcriptional regulator C-terminal domain-containing protein n=1 Tax=Salininema proteolyticum TaxID=1607685 RepID=A0ABV8U593_9ACTN